MLTELLLETATDQKTVAAAKPSGRALSAQSESSSSVMIDGSSRESLKTARGKLHVEQAPMLAGRSDAVDVRHLFVGHALGIF